MGDTEDDVKGRESLMDDNINRMPKIIPLLPGRHA